MVLQEKSAGDISTSASELVAMASRLGVTIATAESCTGGLVGGALTAVPGSSVCYIGGIVSYANIAKTSVLGVDESIIAAHGAVSDECAAAMSLTACERFNADFAIATTGIAGPGGGTPTKPVGLVFIAATRRGGTPVVIRRVFGGDRASVRAAAVFTALELLRQQILSVKS